MISNPVRNISVAAIASAILMGTNAGKASQQDTSKYGDRFESAAEPSPPDKPPTQALSREQRRAEWEARVADYEAALARQQQQVADYEQEKLRQAELARRNAEMVRQAKAAHEEALARHDAAVKAAQQRYAQQMQQPQQRVATLATPAAKQCKAVGRTVVSRWSDSETLARESLLNAASVKECGSVVPTIGHVTCRSVNSEVESVGRISRRKPSYQCQATLSCTAVNACVGE